MKSDIGKTIKEKRKSHGLLQSDLAKYLGISAKTVSAWEVGRNEPDIATIVKIAEMFGCTVSDLTGDPVDVRTKYDEITDFLKNNPEYIDLFNELRKVQKCDILKAIKAIRIFTE